MPRVPALGMLQEGMRTADVTRAINCNVRTVRRLRQRYMESLSSVCVCVRMRACVHAYVREKEIELQFRGRDTDYS